MIKVVIIEDEEYAVKRLQSVLREIAPEFNIVAVIGSIEDSVNWFRKSHAPDLVLMDVHLSDGDCFEIFRDIEPSFPVIFITAYDQYAIQAFRVNGIDYLLKPVKKEEMRRSLDKFKGSQRTQHPQVDFKILHEEIRGISRKFQKRLLVRYGNKITKVDLEEVAYFFAENKNTFLCKFTGRQLPVDQSLEEMSKILDPSLFYRINRKLILHIDSIDSMYSFSRSRIKLKLNPRFPQDVIVSTDRTPAFREWLTGVSDTDQG